jgi:D-alanyl-D-alanine carboxypeptidase
VRRLALLSIFAAALVCAAGGSASAAGPAVEADRALDRALRGLVAAKDGPPGVIAVVQRGGSRRVHSAGVADVEDESALRARRQMRIASVAKAFSGAAALSLVDAGLLGLDDTIGARLPALPAAWHAVTLRQLLGHTSGLPDFTASRGFAEAASASPAVPPPPRRLLSYVESQPPLFPPGSSYRYSNSDNVVVGLIVESVTATTYDRALGRLVLDPLRLRRTLLPSGVALPAGFIHGYARDGTKLEDVSEVVAFGGWAWASGGIVSSPGDLNRFVRGYVGGKLFSGATRRAHFQFGQGHSEPPGPGRNSAGLALFRYRTGCGTVYGHTGSILGYTQLIAATRNGRRSLTFTINEQYTDELLSQLRRAQVAAVCAALAGS